MPFSLEADARFITAIPPHKCSHGHGGIDNGVAIDLLGFEWICFAPMLDPDDSNGTSSFHLEEADDSAGPWVDIPGTTWAADNTSADQQLAHVRTTPRKRWIRCVVETEPGNHNHIGVLAIPYSAASELVLEEGRFAVLI